MLAHAALLATTFTGAVLILIPLVFHLQNKNVSVICLCVWLAVFNSISFINGIVWNGDITDASPSGKGYCDISSRLQIVAQPALMGCAIAILRYLSQILSSKGASATTRANRNKKNLIDLATIFTVPILILILQLIVDRERYAIAPFIGCALLVIPPYSPYLILIFIWAPIMGIIAFVYAILILVALNKKRREFREILRNSQSGLDLNRFTRLFLLAFLAIFLIAPVNFVKFYSQMQAVGSGGLYQADGDFKTIYRLPVEVDEAQLWPLWFAALISIVFAALFGFGKEAFGNYRRWIAAVPGASKLIEYTLDSTSRFSSRLSHSFSAKSSHGESACDPSTPGAFSTYSMSGSIEKPESKTITRIVSDTPSTIPNRQSGLLKTCFPTNLGRGHNQIALGSTTCRVWKETNGDPASPNKIKVQRELVQRSETRQSSYSESGLGSVKE
ncbi:Pheromone receptor a [Taphrina deformans PYCC 5710]|uniref:Pheromone receptor a n=1 Tax=Taphrina deformans (strain PYCC 5710 / ATCC 11124 / CBS 356.35 / IMI 108563 / JCM 9778 / NBRC 8474) TaxID=1097556 RepID=R4XES6_TAPDE|nr:Pheromone receptor a [Taphrina deformans PYCC 5710]|eukprot:CCG81872.1 Pheromone receptor a [Taphrina deformans PYCC 5710]